MKRLLEWLIAWSYWLFFQKTRNSRESLLQSVRSLKHLTSGAVESRRAAHCSSILFLSPALVELLSRPSQTLMVPISAYNFIRIKTVSYLSGPSSSEFGRAFGMMEPTKGSCFVCVIMAKALKLSTALISTPTGQLPQRKNLWKACTKVHGLRPAFWDSESHYST